MNSDREWIFDSAREVGPLQPGVTQINIFGPGTAISPNVIDLFVPRWHNQALHDISTKPRGTSPAPEPWRGVELADTSCDKLGTCALARVVSTSTILEVGHLLAYRPRIRMATSRETSTR